MRLEKVTNWGTAEIEIGMLGWGHFYCSLFAGQSLKCEWGKRVYHFDIWALWQYEVYPLQYLLICLIPLCSS